MERAENEKHTDVARSDKQDFLRIYREAHAQLHRLYHDKDNHAYSDEDLMEFVEEVSASVNLKRTIQDLVDAYFKCFGWKDTMLILRVDDVDMDIHQASEMIESMRKYFVQPNILVFVSCDIEQLEKIKIGDFRKELEDKEVTTWHKELADRYLAKVFPHSHRIQMPEPASYHGQLCPDQRGHHHEPDEGRLHRPELRRRSAARLRKERCLPGSSGILLQP